MKPRQYQLDACAAIFGEFAKFQRTLCVACTGAGKTQIAGYVAKQILDANLGRIMVVCHREELIRQAAARFHQICGVKPDIEKADEWADEIVAYGKASIVVASVQTLISGKPTKRYARFKPEEFAFLWVDESHHAISDSFTEVITYFCQNPKLKCLGVTATPDRADKEALGQIFQSTAFEYELPRAIDDGYLVPIRQQSVRIEGLDFSHVRTTAGDLNEGDLEEVMMAERPLHGVAFATIELACGLPKGTLAEVGEKNLTPEQVGEFIAGKNRRKTLIFCTTVAHAERMAQILCRWMKDSAVDVNGTMTLEYRRKQIAKFTEGDAQFLVNCMVFTEGADLPMTEVVVMARPTKSRALFTQMVGRGTRPATAIASELGHACDNAERRAIIAESSKPCCQILDFVGNNGRHQLVSTVDILGDKDSPDVLELAREYAEKESVDVIEALKKAREEIERKKREGEKKRAEIEAQRVAQRQAEAAKRAQLRGIADYDVTDHDPYAPQFEQQDSDFAPLMAFLRDNLHKTQMARVTPENARKIKADIDRRKAQGLASWKQIRILESNGFPPDQARTMSRTQAGAIMDGLFKKWEAKKAVAS